MLILGLFAAFATVFVAGFTIVQALSDRERSVRALRNIGTFEDMTVAGLREAELAVPISERLVQPALRRLAKFAIRVTPLGVIRRLDETLVHAGITSFDGPRLLAVKVLTTSAGAFAGTTFVLAASAAEDAPPADLLQVIVAGVVLGLIGYYAPEWVVRSRASARALDIQRALPDALDLLSISVTAGLGFEAALDRVSREMRGELGVELYRVVQEMRLGQNRADALRGLSERTDVRELDSFVLAMVQAEAFGVPIANVLATQADELRIKRRQRAEEMAQKIPVKILFPLIACIFPVLFIVILGPPGITIYNNILTEQPVE